MYEPIIIFNKVVVLKIKIFSQFYMDLYFKLGTSTPCYNLPIHGLSTVMCDTLAPC